MVNFLEKQEVLDAIGYELNNSEIPEDLRVERLKDFLITMLHQFVNDYYLRFVEKYPEMERSTFQKKADEALIYFKDKSIGIEETPYLSFLAGGDLDTRNSLAESILEKIQYIAKLERVIITKRDSIKNINKVSDLDTFDFSIDL